jgi:hypothetical protein
MTITPTMMLARLSSSNPGASLEAVLLHNASTPRVECQRVPAGTTQDDRVCSPSCGAGVPTRLRTSPRAVPCAPPHRLRPVLRLSCFRGSTWCADRMLRGWALSDVDIGMSVARNSETARTSTCERESIKLRAG